MEKIILKHDTSINWEKAKNFIPKLGEVIKYDDLNRFKVGNGKDNVNVLGFNDEVNTNVEDEILFINTPQFFQRGEING